MNKLTFTFENCTVVRVIDGDTVELSVDLGFRTWHTDKFRLAGINAIELKAERGQEAKDFTANWLSGTSFRVICHGQEKYGRWLITIYDKDDGYSTSLNAELILAGLAVPMNR